MRRTSIAAVLAAALVAGGCQQWNDMWHKDRDAAKEERMSMTALPEPVRNAFKKEYPDANVSSIVREVEKDGAVHFEIKFTDQSGRKQEVEYDGEGRHAREDAK